jgi:hypothetical protein
LFVYYLQALLAVQSEHHATNSCSQSKGCFVYYPQALLAGGADDLRGGSSSESTDQCAVVVALCIRIVCRRCWLVLMAWLAAAVASRLIILLFDMRCVCYMLSAGAAGWRW